MTKKIHLTIGGASFDMELEEEFARAIEPELAHLFNLDGNNSVKRLLEAFFKKSYEVHELKRALQSTINKLN
ncbi:MAG: hypothetical protein KU37_06630 [Sulfuricurvum sp. PC08-66]|nr:MAG: hypothetical protein KU37_06630 [Sulfuricurvum sp. PC08-66]